MHSNRYTFLYAAGLSLLTALILAFVSEGLKPAQQANVDLDNKINLLRSVGLDLKDRAEVDAAYSKQVEELVINGKGEVVKGMKPAQVNIKNEVAKPAADRTMALYVFTDKAGAKKYIVPLRGVGLWGPIWGNIALNDDFSSIFGATFDHKGETPGLGAEITEKFFQDQFVGKQVKKDGNFVSVRVLKKGMKSEYGENYQVDGISGGTITSNGVDAMLKECIAAYLPYFDTIKK